MFIEKHKNIEEYTLARLWTASITNATRYV